MKTCAHVFYQYVGMPVNVNVDGRNFLKKVVGKCCLKCGLDYPVRIL